MAAVSSSSPSDTLYEDWPRGRIASPDARHDVVLDGPTQPPQPPSTTTTATMQFPPEFQAVLEARQDDYASSSKLQRPMVALEILQAWRSLTPPGRLLRYNTETRLYDDVGDKQAREKIASLLKRQKSVGIHKKREEVGSLQQNAERSSADALPLPVHDDTEMVETSSPSFSSAALSSSLKVPDKKTMLRRVSTQVNYAKKGILYGRQQEQQDIRDIYTSLGSRERDEACHLILLSGQAGVGKSALADSLKETVFKDGGLFVQGKYEQIDDTTRPLSAFQVALSELTVQLVACGEDDGKLALLRSEIRQSLGGESLLLQSLIPSLEQLLGPSPHGSSEQESSKAREIEKEAMTVKRLEFACRMFLRSVSHHYSLVLLLDDLQWADPASLKLLVSLVSDRKVSRMLFLGTHRDGQSSDLCLLNEALVAIRRISTTRVHEIELANLGVADVAGLLADALSIEEEKVTSLSSHLHSATDGNALFLLELFRSLQDDGLVEYDDATSQWTCDSHLIMSTLGSHNVSDFFRGRLLGMPEETQAILVKASCFGSRLDRYLLSLLVNHSNLDYHLVQAAKRGLLTVGESSGEYSFSHDKVQQAAYHMISPSELASFHYHMGRKLLRKLSEADRLDEYVSTVVSQLVKGASKISEDRDRHVVASLCITAGTMAAGTKGFQSASIHFLHGIDILGDRRWTYHYDLCLQLHNLAAEACYCIGEFEQLDELVDETLRHSRFFDDSLQARSTQVYSFSSRGMYTEALETGLATLSDLGEVIPSHPSTMRIIACVTITKRALRKKTNLQILRLHSIVEPRKIAAMQILNLMLISCVYARPALMPVVVCRMVQLTMKHGLCAVSCVGFGWYGLLLSGSLGAIEEGYRYGALSVEMVNSLSSDAWLARVYVAFYGCVKPWRDDFASCLQPLDVAYDFGLSSGDMEYAMLANCLGVWNSLESRPLDVQEDIVLKLTERLEYLGQYANLAIMKPVQQLIDNFTGRAKGDPRYLVGDHVDQNVAVTPQYARESPAVYIWSKFYSMVVAFVFGDYSLALRYNEGIDALYTEHNFGAMDSGQGLFFDCLVLLAAVQEQPSILLRKRGYIRKRLKQFQSWAKHSTENFYGRLHLLNAEFAWATNDHLSARSEYKLAILHSRDRGILMMEALSYERAGRYYWRRDQKELAMEHFQNAVARYETWGGSTKVHHLQKEMDAMLGKES